jgi:hypothetical protein
LKFEWSKPQSSLSSTHLRAKTYMNIWICRCVKETPL